MIGHERREKYFYFNFGLVVLFPLKIEYKKDMICKVF